MSSMRNNTTFGRVASAASDEPGKNKTLSKRTQEASEDRRLILLFDSLGDPKIIPPEALDVVAAVVGAEVQPSAIGRNPRIRALGSRLSDVHRSDGAPRPCHRDANFVAALEDDCFSVGKKLRMLI